MEQSEFDQALLASLKRLGLYIPPAQPADTRAIARHNKQVAQEQADYEHGRAILENATDMLKTTIAATITPAVLPADMPVLEMVKLAKRLGLTVPPALVDVDSDPRPVDATGVVVAPQSAAHDPAHVDGGAYAMRLGQGVHLLRWEPATETLYLSVRLGGDCDFELNRDKTKQFATRAGKTTYARAGYDLPGAPAGITRTLHIDVSDSKPA